MPLTRRVSAVVALASLLGVVALPGIAAAAPASSHGATTPVRVTMTEMKFQLSPAAARIGHVTFTLVNKGSVAHDLKILGKKSVKVAPGRTGKLAVTFAKAGKFAYLCTLPGHAAAGMKGTLTVLGPSTVATMTEMKFALSAAKVKKGTVVFRLVNKGRVAHDIRIAGKKSPNVAAGKSRLWAVAIPKPGKYAYLCTLPGHAAAGMKGTLTVVK